MNESAVKTEETRRGWVGHYKPVWSSQYRTVNDERGNELHFPGEFEAECAAWRALYAIERPVLRAEKGSGVITKARRAADLIFLNPKKPAAERAGE